jgi:hypothetical protein
VTNELGLSKYRCPCFIVVGAGGLYWGQLLRPTLENMDMIQSWWNPYKYIAQSLTIIYLYKIKWMCLERMP